MLRQIFGTTLIAATLSMSLPAQSADIAMETVTATSVVGLVPQTMASHWADAGVNVQLAMGQTLTKSLLKVASGTLDSAVIPTPAFYALESGKGPYTKMGEEKASALAAKVRSLFGFPASFYHAITWADSGINTFADAVGKRVYIGPPAGIANAQITALAAASGLKPGSYEAVKAPWGAAGQGFQDGQFDIYVAGFGLGSQSITEISLQRPIRILGLQEKNQEAPRNLGMGTGIIPTGAYPGMVNEKDVYTWKTLMFIGVQESMDDDVAYRLTKAYFENTKSMGENNALLKHLDGANPFIGVAAPLHPGAIRYYKEQGIEVPTELLGN